MSTTAFAPSNFDPVSAINAASSAAPKLDPATTVAVAKSSQSPQEAVGKAQATFHFGNTVRAFDTLQQMTPRAQGMAWNAMTDAQQSSLRSVGYHPPVLDALHHVGAGGEHGGIWSGLASGITDALHTGWHDAASTLDAARHQAASGVHDVLNAAGSPLRASEHFARAGIDMVNQVFPTMAKTGLLAPELAATNPLTPGGRFVDRGLVPKVLSPADWAHAWRQTTDGTTTLLPSVRRALTSKYGPHQVTMAVRVLGAAGSTTNLSAGMNAVIQRTPQADRQALIRQFRTPKFQDLLNQAANGRISVGRAVVGQKFMADHPLAGRILSGGLDATYDIVATPLLIAGKGVEVARAANWGMTGADVAAYQAGDASKMADVLAKGAHQRYVNRVGDMLARGDYNGIAQFDPKTVPLLEQWKQAGVDSPDALRTWFESQAGMKAMLSGQAARVSHGMTLVPHLTPLGWAKAEGKAAMQHAVSWLADKGKISGTADLQALTDVHLDPADVAGAGSVQQAQIAAKVSNLADAMEQGFLAGRPGRIAAINPARIIQRASTLVPTTGAIDIGEGTADVVNFRRFIQGFLPSKAVEQLTNVFVGATEAMRRQLVRAARMQMLHAAGAYNTPELRDATEKFLAMAADSEDAQRYSVGAIDGIAGDNGIRRNTAVLENQLAPAVSIFSPRDVRRMIQEHSVVNALGINPMAMTDRFMYWWRSAILDRPGFAVRFALTENAGRLLRSGVKDFVSSYLANGAARTMTDEQIQAKVLKAVADGELGAADAPAEIAALKAKSIKPLLPYHPVDRALGMLAQHVPEGIRPMIDTPAKFYGAVMGSITHRWRAAEVGLLKAGGKEHYIDAATHLATYQPVHDTFGEMLSAAHGTGDEFMWTPAAQLKAIANTGKSVLATLRKGGKFSEVDGANPLYAFKWQAALDHIATSKLGRAVLEALSNGEGERVQQDAVMRVLNDPEFAATKARFERARFLPDGRVVGVDATQAEADRAFARTVVDHVNAHVRGGDPVTGPLLTDLVDEMVLSGHAPTPEFMAELVSHHQIPAHVYGPDLLEVHKFENFLSKSFEQLVGRPANWLARQPQFVQMYGDALKDLRPFVEQTVGEGDKVEQLLSDLAMQRAVNAIKPFIHNPEMRTQFEDYHRVLFPFLFAQRQFLMRWGRTFADSPDAIRKLQLTMRGLTTSGFVHRDTNGNDYFYYPGSQYVQELVTGALNSIGVKVSVPMVTPFTGQVKYLVPGLSNPITPSVGPFAAVGMKELAKLFPEMNAVNTTVLGPGASTPIWQQFSPSILNRLYTALGPEQTGNQLATTTMQAIKYLAATGHGLPPNATPQQQQEYVKRVTNWARNLLVVRASLGFVLPATPKATMDPKGLDARFRTLLNELPYTTAVAEYVKEHPTATPYTVSTTESEASGATPATKAALQWMNANRTFIAAHPQAAAWFIPRTGTTFTPAAFREQIALGLRNPKPVWAPQGPQVENFLDDVIMAKAANIYYKNDAAYQKAYNATTSSSEHQQLAHIWDSYKASFDKQNPVFAEYIASQAGHVKRMETIRDLQKAVTTPHAPESPAVPQMRELLRTYDTFQSDYGRLAGLSTYSSYEQQRAMKTAMISLGNAYVAKHPQVADLWNTVLRPEVDATK